MTLFNFINSTMLSASVLLCVLLILLARLPRTDALSLKGWPSPQWLSFQAIVSLLGKRKQKKSKANKVEGPQILNKMEVSLVQPLQFSAPRFTKFLSLAGFNEGLSGGTPLSYPIVESFRLCIQAMLLPSFPFNVMGSVLARNRTLMVRAVAADERLVYRCAIEPQTRISDKGYTEVDLVSTASSSIDGQLVWKNTLTVIIMSTGKGKAASPRTPTAPASSASKATGGSGGCLGDKKVVDTWELAGDVGRRYGALSGDWNPIHLHAAASQLFGFKRPIAHALMLVARCEASLHNQGVRPIYPAVLETEFKRPTLLPATLVFAVESHPDFAMRGEGVHFAVLTQDAEKQVLVGRLICRSG